MSYIRSHANFSTSKTAVGPPNLSAHGTTSKQAEDVVESSVTEPEDDPALLLAWVEQQKLALERECKNLKPKAVPQESS
ncbi:hypothetical protein A0H81_12305 [Grifola frondosa]|uniref:Uncharacterized protein n=1 Tax=Grifola frondosa TaxID=5627 RepID=A0A1C7LT99_GRIFR|nr:hypothetical protein A0H81_12305 [Grifola frondosa]